MQKKQRSVDHALFNETMQNHLCFEWPLPVPVPENICGQVRWRASVRIDRTVLLRHVLRPQDHRCWTGVPEQMDRLLAVLRALKNAAKKTKRDTFTFSCTEPDTGKPVRLTGVLHEDKDLENVFDIYCAK